MAWCQRISRYHLPVGRGLGGGEDSLSKARATRLPECVWGGGPGAVEALGKFSEPPEWLFLTPGPCRLCLQTPSSPVSSVSFFLSDKFSPSGSSFSSSPSKLGMLTFLGVGAERKEGEGVIRETAPFSCFLVLLGEHFEFLLLTFPRLQSS